MTVTGTFSATLIPNPVRFPGTNVIFEHSGIGLWSGDISGNTLGVHRWVAHANGFTTVRVELTFTNVEIQGTSKSGELYALFLGKSVGPGVGEGTWQIIGGTEELSSLKGGGTWSPGEYTGQIHFEP